MPRFKYKKVTKKIIGAAMHFAQARNYLEAYNLKVGLLLNFGAVSLEYKRLENPKYNPNLKSPKSILIHPNPRSDK